ncbi:MAG TPA: ribosome maturation factor RimM, partial [Candidatus Kurthia intestinigallinarum]|nr:ribosome maturation factor RimM [Candidatus Kurthia intestinigallinarum]
KVNENFLEELEEDEFYYHEIVGCDVFDENGNEIGKIKEIFETGANDVWTVTGIDGKEHYLPVIFEVIKEVDVENKRVTIELMEGLLS